MLTQESPTTATLASPTPPPQPPPPNAIPARRGGPSRSSVTAKPPTQPTGGLWSLRRGLDETRIKVVILGDGASGKTAIIRRLVLGSFEAEYNQTVGLDFYQKRVLLPGERTALLHLWDIGGHAIESKMAANYLYAADVVLLVYDISHYGSFKNLEDWLQLVRKCFDPFFAILLPEDFEPASNENGAGEAGGEGNQLTTADSAMKRNARLPYIALVADLYHMRTVKPDQHARFVSENMLNASFFVSGKTGDQIGPMFVQIAANSMGMSVRKPDLDIIMGAQSPRSPDKTIGSPVSLPSNIPVTAGVMRGGVVAPSVDQAARACSVQ
ncbi:P-loop containing nucleoside triphosphate hydrolase protein [Cladochytrium replicatum]|nr:P-loop containing nucleoside triphosphate hydrolase protein [Cladochytrium replicatum]